MAEQSLKEKTAKGLFWGGISNGIQQILVFAFGIILLRILDAEDYGMITTLSIFTGIASSIQESGFTNALVNKKEIRHEDYNAVFWFNVFSGGILYAILFFSAPLIALFYDKPPLTNLSRVLFLSFFFSGFGISHNAILFKKLMVKERAKSDIYSLLLSSIIGIILAISGLAYWSLAIQTTLYLLFGTLFRWYYSPWRPSFPFSFTPLKKMFSFSFKLFLSGVFTQINNNMFSVLLGKFYKIEQAGYYSQGQKWMSMGNSLIAGMINGVTQPVLVQSLGDSDRQKNIFRKMLRFGAFISFPLMLGLAFVGKEFIIIVAGEKWLPAVPFLQMFCIWGAFSYLNVLFNNLLVSYGKSDAYMWCIICTGLLQLISFIFTFPYGILTMAAVYISLFFAGLAFQYFFARKLINTNIFELCKDILPYMAAVSGSFLLSWLITRNLSNIYLTFSLKILLSAVFYLFFMWKGNSTIFRESCKYLLEKKTNKTNT